MKRCVIVQPSYIPWRGYFDLIHRADVFVFYDDVQYDKEGWRNRNRVKSPRGTTWLTIPVKSHGVVTRQIPINRVEIADDRWAQNHLQTLTRLYGVAPHFEEHRTWLEGMYASPPRQLAEFTIPSTMAIAARLGITSTTFVRSSELSVKGRRTDRLVSVLQKVGGTHYLSGPSARHYLEVEKLKTAGITLEWMSYDYPEYPQLYPPYDPYVTVLDLMFMTGSTAPDYIWAGANAKPTPISSLRS